MPLVPAANMCDCGELACLIGGYYKTNSRGLFIWFLHEVWYSSVASSDSGILALELDLCMQPVRNSSLEGKKVSSMTYKKGNKEGGFQTVIMKR